MYLQVCHQNTSAKEEKNCENVLHNFKDNRIEQNKFITFITERDARVERA